MKILNSFKINNIRLDNRICVSPMCQYSGINGSPSKWHYIHLKKLMQVGAGIMMIESTAVSKSGMITEKDLALKNKNNFKKFRDLIKSLKKISNTKIGLQISHAGRKGSAKVPWIKSNSPITNKKKSWTTFSASAIQRDSHWPVPKELSLNQIKKIKKDFFDTTFKAKKTSLDCLEIHMSHGYLLHQFFSPISNKRSDEYGGNLKNRCRLLLEIATEVRKIWPKNKILGARVNGFDWVKKGSTVNDCVYLAKKLEIIGFDYVCVTSGGILPKTNLKYKPGYQVFLAKKIKAKTKILVRTTGMIKNLNHGENILKNKSADLISFGRKFINSPTWLIKELKKRKKKVMIPNQYKRCF